MQAILLAAGMGKRLGELTKDRTKCMVEVNGEKLIDRTIKILSSLDITRLIIVIGFEGQRLKEYVEDKYNDVIDVDFIENPIYYKTNNIYSLALAKEEMCKDDTILLESDLIYNQDMVQLLLSSPYKNAALVAKYEPWMDGTMVQIDSNNNIVNFIPKSAFDYCAIETYYKTVNIYKFSKDFSANSFLPFLEAYCKAMGNNEYYEQVLSVLAHLHNNNLKALPITTEKWYEIDDVQDLDIASCIFSEDVEKLSMYHKRYGGFWRFPNMIDFCYLVNPYFPTKRMIDEMSSNYEVLLRNYPSGMSVNQLLAAKMFDLNHDFIIVGNGAAELIKSLMNNIEGKVGMVFPTFEEYSNRKNTDDIVAFYPNNWSFSYNANDLIDYYGDKEISTLLIINPDNPSGNFIPKNQLLELCQWTKDRNIRLVIDESFVDFSEDFEDNSLLHKNILLQYENLVVVKSISKSHGVPGLRLGVIASSDTNFIKIIKQDVAIWNINSFGEFYMQIFGKYSSDYIKACHSYIEERNLFENELKKIPYLKVLPSQANFFMLKVLPPHNSSDLAKELLNKYNILIKDCNNKTGVDKSDYIRLAIRNRHDNDLLINALKNIK